MKIIAVNINKALAAGTSPFDATKRAWIINEKKFRADIPKYVIGVSRGDIKGFYELEAVNKDVEPRRLKFTLKEIKETTITNSIKRFTSGKKLKHFVVKYNW